MLIELIKLADELDREGKLEQASIIDEAAKLYSELEAQKQNSINNLLDFSDHLDRSGLGSHADMLDSLLKKNAEDEDDNEDNKNSDWHDLNLKELTDKMKDDGLKSMSIDVSGFSIRVTENQDD